MILFAWIGFPQYGARCVDAFVKQSKEKCAVIATRPSVPVEGMERVCSCPVFWVGETQKVDVVGLIGEMPRVLIVSGWSVPSVNHLRDTVRKAGGRILCGDDENFDLNFREVIKAIRFNIRFRRLYDGFFVPGKSGVRLMRFFGVPEKRIYEGFYSADPGLFYSSKSILDRPKRILFVGQIIKRKNILPFAEAFLSIAEDIRKDWELEICGSGELEPELALLGRENPSLIVHSFVQPEQLAELYREARFFALPSLEEHWGLVVHEGALSGCVLLVSKQIGANDDFVTEENSCLFDARDFNSMKYAIEKALKMTDNQLLAASAKSLEMSKNASLEKFVDGINRFLAFVG